MSRINPVWITYLNYYDEQVVTKARIGPNQWLSFVVQQGGCSQAAAPAMAICHEQLGVIDEPSVYVVYGVLENGHSSVLFDRVGLVSGVTQHTPIIGPTEMGLYSPSIATTPGDTIHVTWRVYHFFDAYDRVQYRQRRHGEPNWRPIEDVSDPSLEPASEPAFHPSVEAYGDSIHVVWRGRNIQGGAYDVWKRSREAGDPPFGEFRNRSQSQAIPSEYPQHSMHWTTAWQEGVVGAEDIWAHVFEEICPIYMDPPSSTYPNITAEWFDNGGTIEYLVHTLWTNTIPSGHPAPYEVMYQRYLCAPHDGYDDPVYYGCAVGDSVPSRFCLARDGRARWRGYAVDFGLKRLRYRLTSLNPNYDYQVKAVLFQASQDTWRQNFAFDSIEVADVAVRPLVPETVLLTIPRELYARSCGVTLDIAKLAGKYAVLADLKVYQCEPYRKPSRGYGFGGVQVAKEERGVSFCSFGPTLFSNATRLSYTVTQAQPITVTLYDIQGRVVRTLATGEHMPGAYTLRWDGRNASGVRVPAGAYFCRLGATGPVRKVVLTE